MRKIPRRMRVAAAKLMTDRALAKLAPIPVPSTGSPEVRLFLGHAGVRGALASAYSFLRYRAFPLIVHEDGTLTGEDWRRIVTLFPGAQLVEARQARSRTMRGKAR